MSVYQRDGNVFVFFRPAGTLAGELEQVARCAKERQTNPFTGSPLSLNRYPREKVEIDIKETGLAIPVLIDEGDALNGRLGVALCPVTASRTATTNSRLCSSPR